MIFMPIIMFAPILALPLFYYFPLGTVLPIYIVILIASVYCNVVMVLSMRAKAKCGVKAMIGQRALVIQDIAPEGKVELSGEIWRATAGNKPIAAGQEVKVLDVKELVLIVDEFNEDGHGDER